MTKSRGVLRGTHDKYQDIAVRFFNRVEKTETCWLWAGRRSQQGYGLIGHEGRDRVASRISWQLHHGIIPPGMVICHRCDNPPCVNPQHLFVGTHADNVMDKVSKGRASGGSLPGELHNMVVLTEEQVREIRAALANPWHGVGQHLADKFGVTKCTISAIKHRRLWKHIP